MVQATVGIRARAGAGGGRGRGRCRAGFLPTPLGGIGFYIQLYIRAFQYDKVATLTVVVLAMVIALEQLSVWIRRRLR